MSDILKGVTGNWTYLLTWLVPSGLFVGLFALIVWPVIEVLPYVSGARTWSTVVTTTALVGATVTIGFILSAISTTLYRLLEGYVGWPGWLVTRRTKAHKQRRAKLIDARDKHDKYSLEYALLDEQVQRYPRDENQFGPTLLGNAMRSFESYGATHYGLDSQLLWGELFATAPDAMQLEHDRARAGVDFFVGLLWTSIALGLVCIGAVLARFVQDGTISWGRVGFAAALLTIVPLSAYRGAVTSTSYWASMVAALVNTGRARLAALFGLCLPDTLEEERAMWGALWDFVVDPTDKVAVSTLDKRRLAPASAASANKIG
jgi:hypothetical protein